jgi:hypothetical protein
MPKGPHTLSYAELLHLNESGITFQFKFPAVSAAIKVIAGRDWFRRSPINQEN